jgi:hypothetical protein
VFSRPTPFSLGSARLLKRLSILLTGALCLTVGLGCGEQVPKGAYRGLDKPESEHRSKDSMAPEHQEKEKPASKEKGTPEQKPEGK